MKYKDAFETLCSFYCGMVNNILTPQCKKLFDFGKKIEKKHKNTFSPDKAINEKAILLFEETMLNLNRMFVENENGSISCLKPTKSFADYLNALGEKTQAFHDKHQSLYDGDCIDELMQFFSHTAVYFSKIKPLVEENLLDDKTEKHL